MARNWFPKTLAEWREPKAFARRRAEEDDRDFHRRPWYLFLLLFAVLMLGPIFRSSDGFQLPPPEKAFEALLKILVMVLLPTVALVASRFGSRVWITEHGFHVGNRKIPFDSLLRVVPVDREIDGRRFTVLRLEDLKGKPFDVAVADTISLARIEEILRRETVRCGS